MDIEINMWYKYIIINKLLIGNFCGNLFFDKFSLNSFI